MNKSDWQLPSNLTSKDALAISLALPTFVILYTFLLTIWLICLVFRSIARATTWWANKVEKVLWSWNPYHDRDP